MIHDVVVFSSTFSCFFATATLVIVNRANFQTITQIFDYQSGVSDYAEV